MNHKGTESRKKKSLVLNQALILHDKWQSSGLDSCLISLPNHCPRDALMHLHLCFGAPTSTKSRSGQPTGPWGCCCCQGCPASSPALLGLPQAPGDVWTKFRAPSKPLQGLWSTWGELQDCSVLVCSCLWGVTPGPSLGRRLGFTEIHTWFLNCFNLLLPGLLCATTLNVRSLPS